MTVRLQLLGQVRAWLGEHEVALGSAQQRGFLALLAMAAGRPLSRQQLIDGMWGEQAPATAGNIIQGHVFQLRRVLEPGRPPRRPSEILPAISDGYLLRVNPDDVDALRLRRCLDRAAVARRTGDDAAVVSLLGKGLASWQPPLAGASFFTVQTAATALIEDWWHAVGWYGDAAIRCGIAAEVLPLVRDAATHRPLDESAQARLIRTYHAVGRRADAFEVFRHTRSRLCDELGVDPGQELVGAYESALVESASEPAEVVAAPATPAPAQLPPRNALFAGRGDQLTRLRTRLDTESVQTPIVCLEGTGGVGKTALAVELAHDVAQRFPDGQIFLDLGGHDEATAITAHAGLVHVLRSLGADESRFSSNVEQLAAHYRTQVAARRLLIFLDNAVGTDQILPLLPATPSCALIVTSRHALTALATRHAVYRLTVDVLPASDSLRLLANVAGSARIDRESVAAQRLRELCGDLPLALCLAAARLTGDGEEPLARLVAELADEQDRLGALAVEGESRSVRGALGWSYRALAAPVARAFRLLSLHPGSTFTVDLVAATTGHTLDAARRAVGALTAANLITDMGTGRYRFHDLIRLYAGEMLAQDSLGQDSTEAERRLLDWYLTIVDACNRLINPLREAMALEGPPPHPVPFTLDSPAALDYLTGEADNLPKVVRHSATKGHASIACRLTYLLFSFYISRSRPVDFVECARWGRLASESLGDDRVRAHVLNVEGVAANVSRGLERAADCHREQIALWQRLGDRGGEAAGWNNLGGALSWLNRHEEALDAYQHALELWNEAGDTIRCGISLDNIGDTARDLADLKLSNDSLERSLRIWQETGNQQGQGQALYGLAKTRFFAGDPRGARELFERAWSVQDAIGDHRMGVLSLYWMARIDGEHSAETALACLGDALSMAIELREPQMEGSIQTSMAEIHIRQGNLTVAREFLARSRRALAQTRDPLETGLLHHTYIRLSELSGDPEAAREHLLLAQRSYTEAGCIESKVMLERLALPAPAR